MTTYFGFIPTTELNQQLDNVIDMVNNQSDEAFYPHQLAITKKIAHEIVDNIFLKLIDIIEDPKRQEKMKKVVANIDTATDTLLKHILTPQPNNKVMDAFNFLLNDCLFEDNDQQRRVGFAMNATKAQTLINHFNQVKNESINTDMHDSLIEAMDIIIAENLQHYLKDFSKHLHLGMLKRKAIPIAEGAISKASKVATHKLLPDMQRDACLRLVNHFEGFLVTK